MKTETTVVDVHISRHAALPRAEKFRRDGTHGGIPRNSIPACRAEIAGEKPVGGGKVIASVMRQASNDGHLVHHLGVIGQLFADANTGHIRGNGLVRPPHLTRCVGLHVEGVELGRTTVLPDEDDGTTSARNSRRVFGSQKIGEQEPRNAQPAHGEETASTHAIAEARGISS